MHMRGISLLMREEMVCCISLKTGYSVDATKLFHLGYTEWEETRWRLREELVSNVELANNLLFELNWYLDQLRTHAPELLRVEALPDHPFIKYDFSAQERANFADMRNSNNLVARSMMIALNAKNKLKIITGEYIEPEVGSRMRAMWKKTNDMIISWILNSIAE
nr:cysteine-rich RLK (receptor-like protein kinase) 8 [Tanacetum cinerariifolium]GEZ94888.1 cysteine-rich RLK (receptor-like protein kinase) 8 [Tanacetum cinerariifolium]